jgi:hypothetical protein
MARKEKEYHFIYKTTNMLTGRYYYGMHSTDNLNDGYLGSGKRLRYSINKYGKDNHKREIVEFCPNRSSLKKRENELVTLNEIVKDNCMNLMIGGEGGFSNEKHKDKFFEIAAKNAKLNGKKGNLKFIELMKNDNWKMNQIKKQSIGQKKHCENYGGYFSNKKHTEKSKQKIGKTNSLKLKGENNSQYGTHWITNGVNNKKIKKDAIIPNGWYYGRIIRNLT